MPCSRSSAWPATVDSVEIAPLATDGSVASASISICGLSPRSTRRAKSDGMVTTNSTLPLAISASASLALETTWSKR